MWANAYSFKTLGEFLALKTLIYIYLSEMRHQLIFLNQKTHKYIQVVLNQKCRQCR